MKLRHIFLLLVVICLLLVMTSCGGRYYLWNATGPIQAIGNEEELWLFLQVDRMVRIPSYFGCAFLRDYSRVYPTGHLQELLVFKGNTLKDRIRINSRNNMFGVSFHPNLSRIFRMDDSVYLFTGESRDRLPTLYRWEGDRFVMLSLDESNSFVIKHSPSFFSNLRSDSLDGLTESDGWRFLYAGSVSTDARFPWSDNVVKVQFSGQNQEHFILNVEITNTSGETLSTGLTYEKGQEELTRKEYDALPATDYGHPKG